jgi:predicted secreted Zn-dependent protease
MNMDRFNVKKLNEGEVKEQFQVTIKNRFTALEIVEDNEDFNRVWDTIRENIKNHGERPATNDLSHDMALEG